MLILNRRPSETIIIDGGIKITYLGLDKLGNARIGLDVPKEIKVLRGELERHDENFGNK